MTWIFFAIFVASETVWSLRTTPPIQTTMPADSPSTGAQVAEASGAPMELIPAGALGDVQTWASQDYTPAADEAPPTTFEKPTVVVEAPPLNVAKEIFGSQSFTLPSIQGELEKAFAEFVLFFTNYILFCLCICLCNT